MGSELSRPKMDPANDREALSPGRDGAVERPRSARGPNVVHEEMTTLELPPEVWARVLEYSTFDAVLTCVSRSMLHDALPLLKRLRIDKSSQLNLKVASRFRDIRDIEINCLLSSRDLDMGDPDDPIVCELDFDSRIRAVPFLSKFDALESVHFGGKDEDGQDVEGFAPVNLYFFEGDDGYPREGERESMLAFIDQISGAYQCGALPTHLRISGLCCPDSATGNYSRDCESCMRACKSFPLESVCRFEVRGSSSPSARSGRQCGLDVCIERAQIESVIESRPGGRDLLRTTDRLLYLLGRGRLYNISADDVARAIHIVKFNSSQLKEIKRVIQYAELDVKKLSMQKLSNAVRRSFTRAEDDPIPANGDRYFSEASLDYLEKKIGLNIDRNEIGSDAGELVSHAQQIAWVLSETRSRRKHGSSSDLDEYEDILVDSLKLVRCFSEIGGAPIQQIACAIPYLADCLRGTTNGCQEEAVMALRNILKKGTAEHRKMVLEAKPMQAFSRLLASSNASIAKAAVVAFDNIVAHEGMDKATNGMGTYLLFPRLVGLLDSKDDECVRCALRVLAVAANESQMTRAIDKGLFSHVVRLMELLKVADGVLAHCSVLLRKILEHRSAGKPHIEQVLESEGLVARMVELARTSQDDVVGTNLTQVVIHIAEEASDQHLDVLAQEKDLLSLLVDQLTPDGHAERALVALEKISDGSLERCRLVLQAGVTGPLLRLLKSASALEPSLLEAATKTFSMLCRHQLFDPDEAKDSLKLSTQLLSSNDPEIASNSSWALYHLLDGLSESHLSEVVDKGLVRKVLKSLSAGLPEVLQPALEALCLIARRAGDDSVNCITNCGGIACIKKTLFSSHDNTQKLACRVLSNIVAGNEQHIQAVIDAKVVPCLFQVLTSEQNREYALEALRVMTEGATAAQIDCLVALGCIHHFCDIVDAAADCSTTTLALQALKNIAKAGTEEAKLSKLMMESKLDDIMKETLDLQRESSRFDLLRKKEAWLAVDALEAKIEALEGAHQIVKDQLGDEERVLHSFEQKIAGIGTETLGEAKFPLREAKEAAMKLLSSKMSSLEGGRRTFTVYLAHRLKVAEKIAPKSEWYDRLANDGSLPSDVETVSLEKGKAMSAVSALETARDSDQRRLDVDEIRTGLRRLFKSKETTKKRAKPAGESQEPARERRTSKKQRKEEDGDDDVIDLCSDSDSD
ncbi:LOW QUALITY PROTEIN: hypothetical protein ACHAXT_011929 [Thalassiosira profunda]